MLKVTKTIFDVLYRIEDGVWFTYKEFIDDKSFTVCQLYPVLAVLK